MVFQSSSPLFFLARLSTRRPILCLILSLLLIAPFLTRLPYVQTVDNVDYFTVEGDPDVAFYESLQKIFGDDEFFIIAFSHPDLFSSPLLRTISDITEELEALPEIRKVQSLANVDFIHGGEDYFEVRPFLEDIPEDPDGLDALKIQALGERLYVGNLVSADGLTTAIIVFPAPNGSDDEGFRKRLLDKTQTILERHKREVDRFHLAGWTVTNYGLSHYMKADVSVFIPLCYLFVTLTVWLVFRNIRLTVLAVINISACTGATMGAFPMLGITLNNITTIVPPLIMAMALSDVVHVFTHLDKDLIGKGQNPAHALETILLRIITPSFLCSLTTAVGFISLVVSDIPPIKDFALTASLGMIFEFVFSFLLLPPLMLLSRPERIFTREEKKTAFRKPLLFLSNSMLRHPLAISIASLFIIAGSICLASTIRVETNLLDFFKPSTPLRQELAFVESRLAGVGSLDISLKSKTPDAFREPANLQVIERLQDHCDALAGVDRTMSFIDFLKDMNQAFHNESPEFNTVPTSREMVSQYLLLYDSDDIEDFITPSCDHARILVRISKHSSADQARIIDDLRAFITGMDANGLSIRITGRAVQDVNTIDALVWGQVQSLALAAAVIFLIMFLALRSFATGALSIIPNIFPIALNFGIMGALGVPLNTATALISVVALGIAVDDTIHFLTEYNRKRVRKIPVRDALNQVIMEKGVALTATSIILTIGFGVLIFSNFTPTMNFGGLSAFIMVTAWIGDVVTLPGMILALHRTA
jgi:predicted RND superfamily exporter protein